MISAKFFYFALFIYEKGKKMKKIIALEGPENSGKTTTLNLLITKLLKYSKVQKVEKYRDFKDKAYVFYLNEKKIMITTRGDKNELLLEDLDRVVKNHQNYFDVIVYAKHPGIDFECIVDIKKRPDFDKNEEIIKKTKNNTLDYFNYKSKSGKTKTIGVIDAKMINEDLVAAKELYQVLLKYI